MALNIGFKKNYDIYISPEHILIEGGTEVDGVLNSIGNLSVTIESTVDIAVSIQATFNNPLRVNLNGSSSLTGQLNAIGRPIAISNGTSLVLGKIRYIYDPLIHVSGVSNGVATVIGTLTALGNTENICFHEVKYIEKEYYVNYNCNNKNMGHCIKIERVHRDESNLNFVIRFPKGRTMADIKDVKFLVKRNDSSLLTDALIVKTLLSGEITLSGLDKAKVVFLVSDYDNIEIDHLYRAALFCKWQESVDFDENVANVFDFQTIQNFDNNN